MLDLTAQAILDAGLRSADSGKLETVVTGPWAVGWSGNPRVAVLRVSWLTPR